MRVKCLAHSGVECTNHEATVLPTRFDVMGLKHRSRVIVLPYWNKLKLLLILTLSLNIALV